MWYKVEYISTLFYINFGKKMKENVLELTMNLPRNYVEIEEEEMMYLDGGFRISYSTLFNTINCCIYGITTSYIFRVGICKVATMISRVVGKITAKVGAIFGGWAGSLLGYVIGSYCGWKFGKQTGLALRSKKGLEIGWGGIKVK